MTRILAYALVALLGLAAFAGVAEAAAPTMRAAPAHADDRDASDCSEGTGDNCAGDDCGDCLPGVGCRCHTPTGIAVAHASVTATALVAHAVACPLAITRAHANPDPFEILHVPRRAT